MSASDSTWPSALLEGNELAVVGVDTRGRTTFWSPGAQALFGWPAEDVLGRVPPIVPPPLLQEWELQMQRVLKSGAGTPAAETQRVTRDGQWIWVVRSASPVRDTQGQLIGLVDTLIDVTALKQLDDESRAVAQVRERDLIAMDLHDGLIQSLYGLVLNLAAQEQSLDPSRQHAALQALKLARAEIERVMEEARNYVSDLRAREFTPRNMAAGLQVLADGLRLNAGIDDVRLSFDPSVEAVLPPETRGHLLYLVHEAVSNVLRHAHASRVRIELMRSEQSVVLRVVDNGQGFRPAQDRLGTLHRGLRNMAERAKLVGGKLEIKSRKGRGTRVCLEIPVLSAEC